MSYSLAYTQAVAIMLFLGALNRFKGVEWMSAAQISSALGIPRPTVANILSRLLAANIIETKEGIKGGMRLSRLPENISLLDIFDAIEQKKPLFKTRLSVPISTAEFESAKKKVLDSFDRAETGMRDALNSVRLCDLFACQQ